MTVRDFLNKAKTDRQQVNIYDSRRKGTIFEGAVWEASFHLLPRVLDAEVDHWQMTGKTCYIGYREAEA